MCEGRKIIWINPPLPPVEGAPCYAKTAACAADGAVLRKVEEPLQPLYYFLRLILLKGLLKQLKDAFSVGGELVHGSFIVCFFLCSDTEKKSLHYTCFGAF